MYEKIILKKLTSRYLLDVLTVVEVVVVGLLLFLVIEVEDDFLFPFLCVALSTASLCGNTIWDGATGIILFSVLQLAACFFCFFFGGPLHRFKNVNSKRHEASYHVCKTKKMQTV
jgi:hypothetical protein